MKWVAVILMSVLSLSLQAQVFVDSVDINELSDVHLIKVECRISSRVFGNRGVEVIIDYGLSDKLKEYHDESKSYKDVRFKTEMGAINFLENNGWRLESVVTTESIHSRFIMRRKQ